MHSPLLFLLLLIASSKANEISADEIAPTAAATITGGSLLDHWPHTFNTDGYYATKSPGRHLIQFKLPAELPNEDYRVFLNFYHTGLGDHPDIQFHICDNFEVSVENSLSSEARLTGLRHEYTFNPSKLCLQAENKTIGYSITIHDEDCLLGWNYLLLYPVRTHDLTYMDHFLQWQANNAYLCNLRSCDRGLFDFSDFEKMLTGGGLLAGPSRRQAFEIDVDKPLRLSFKLDNYDSAKQDACFKYSFYVLSDTTLKLLAEEPNGELRILEIINDTSGLLKQNELCLGDYYFPHRGERNTQNYSLKFAAEKISCTDIQCRIGNPLVILATRNLVKFCEQKPLVDYLPDISGMKNISLLSNYWRLSSDSGGLASSYESIDNAALIKISQPATITSEFSLRSSWIDASEWDRSQDELNLNFYYQSLPFDTLKEVHFECHYHFNGSMNLVTFSYSDLSGKTNMDIKYNLENIPMDAFRIDLRHKLSPISTDPQEHILTINKLSFGDICSNNLRQCSKSAKCEPSGFLRFLCRCDEGFYGHFCDKKSTCEVIQEGGSTGHQMCALMSAECNLKSQVLRCLDPDGNSFDPLKRNQQTEPGEARDETKKEKEKPLLESFELILVLLFVALAISECRVRFQRLKMLKMFIGGRDDGLDQNECGRHSLEVLVDNSTGKASH